MSLAFVLQLFYDHGLHFCRFSLNGHGLEAGGVDEDAVLVALNFLKLLSG